MFEVKPVLVYNYHKCLNKHLLIKAKKHLLSSMSPTPSLNKYSFLLLQRVGWGCVVRTEATKLILVMFFFVCSSIIHN